MSKRKFTVETLPSGRESVICDRFRIHPAGIEFFNYGSQEQFVIFYPVGSFLSMWQDHDYKPGSET